MQFFFLVIINIFIGAVLYLVISLKLERSAQDFRSRRMRKEMDEIIKEFNATAERNITLLENRISILQRLLERSGNVKSLDISIGDVDEPAAAETPAGESRRDESTSPVNGATDFPVTAVSFSLIDRLKNSMASIVNAIDMKLTPRNDHKTAVTREPYAAPGADMHVPADETAAAPVVIETVQLEDDEILEILRSAENRYDAITRLHEKGCSLESLSKCSGIPAGEIALVLNLQNTRTS